MFEKIGDNDNPNILNKKQVVKQQSDVSNDLIFEEILTRLPVKSVLRFKSVSKQWYSTLSSSDFANTHLIRSPLSHPSAPVNTLFIEHGLNCYLFSYDDDVDQISSNFEDNLVKLEIDFDVEKDDLELAGSCNGLICLSCMSGSTPASNEYFIIWNPSTRKLHKYASYGYLERFNNEQFFFVAPGFGYVSSVDDYKYVRILTVLWNVGEGGFDGTGNIVHIFSLKENNWREIDFDYVGIAPYGRAVLINEKLYWAARSGGDDELVVSFDLGAERFDVINFNLDRFENLGVMGGCLSKCNCDKTFTGDRLIHVLLEPPAIAKSTIGVPKGLRLDTTSEMIGFTRTDKFFVTGPFNDEPRDFQSRTLGIVDTRMKRMQYTMLLRFDNFFKISRYVPSLISPIPIEETSEA